MIKQYYHTELVDNILTTNSTQNRLLISLQILSSLLALVFAGWQAMAETAVYNSFFVVMWVLLETGTVLWMCFLHRAGTGGCKTASWEAKQAILSLLTNYSSLRYAKFIAILCNFLGVVGAIKSMRFLGRMQWSAILCVGCLVLCILWLREMNLLLGKLLYAIDLYGNFEMEPGPEIELQSLEQTI